MCISFARCLVCVPNPMYLTVQELYRKCEHLFALCVCAEVLDVREVVWKKPLEFAQAELWKGVQKRMKNGGLREIEDILTYLL